MYCDRKLLQTLIGRSVEVKVLSGGIQEFKIAKTILAFDLHVHFIVLNPVQRKFAWTS